MGILDGLTELATFGGRSSSNLGRFTLDHPEFAPTVLKLPEDQDRGLVATLFGVPVGFQLGTALGLDGWTALGVDIATDPLTYLGIGGFLKGGRAARAPGRLVDAVAGAKGASIAEKVGHIRSIAEKSAALAIEPWEVLDDLAATAKDKDDFLAKLFELKRSNQGRPVGRAGTPIGIEEQQKELFRATAGRVSAGQWLERLSGKAGEEVDIQRALELPEMVPFGGEGAIKGIRRETERLGSMQAAGAAEEGSFLSTALPADTDIAKLRNRVSRGGVEAGRAFIRNEIEKRRTIQTAIQQLSQVNGPEKFQLYADVAKRIRELKPPEGLKTLFSRQATRDMREYFRAYGQGRKVEPLGRSLEEQARKGQRALITMGIPLTERRIPLITGAPVFGAIDRSPGLKAIGQFFKASPYAGAAAKANTFLREERPAAAFDTVYERALNYVDALRGGEPPPVPDAVNVAHAKYADERLVDDAGYALVQEFGAAIPKKEEQQLIYQMLDKPEKFLDDFPDAQGIFAMRTFAPSNLKAEWQGKVTDDMLRVAEAMQQAFRGTKAVLTDQYDMINSAIQDYAPRIVTPVKKAEWQAKLDFIKTRQGLETQTSHLKKRLIPFLDDLFELEKKGIVKVEKDPMVVFREYFGGIGRAVATRRFVDRLASISVPFPDEATGIPLVVKDLDSLPKKAAELYTQTADPFLLKAAGKTSGAGYIPAGAWIHQDFAKAMRVLLEPPGPTTGSKGLRFHEKLFDWGLTANALSKRMLLSFDLFSYVAMTEKAIALQGGTFLRNPAGFVSQGLQEIGQAGDMYKLAVKNGMDLRRNVDLEHEILGRAFKAADNWAMTKRVPLVPAGVRAVRATLHAIDRPVYDHYVPGLKMASFMQMFPRAMRVAMERGLSVDQDKIAADVAAIVNQAFTGLAWERYWISKSGQNLARVALVAPNFTTSNLLMARDIFANWFHRKTGLSALGRDIVQPEIRQHFAREYALRQAFVMFGLLNLVNLAMVGHFMDENEEGHKTEVALPFKEQGRQVYWRFGRAFRDVFSLVNVFDDRSGPIQFARRRMGILPSAVWTQVTGRDLFGNQVISVKDGPMANAVDRIWQAGSRSLPIGAQEIFGAGAQAARPFAGFLNILGIETRRGPEQKASESLPQEVEDPTPVPPEVIPAPYWESLEAERRELGQGIPAEFAQ